MPLDLPGHDLLAYLLHDTSAMVTRQVGEMIHHDLLEAGICDLRPAHFRVFEFLPATGSRLTDMARQAQVTKQSMGHLVDELVQLGYVERIADPTDGRASIIRRTERGWKAENIAMNVMAKQDEYWRNRLGEAWYAELTNALETLSLEIRQQYEQP